MHVPGPIGSKWAGDSHKPVRGSLFVATFLGLIVVDTDHDELVRKRLAQSIASATDI
jgi:hypothetical protein